MGRIMAIDYGLKRTGVAVTDPLKIIATALATVETPKMVKFLKEYLAKEEVELVIIGMPSNWDESDTHATQPVKRFIETLQKQFPFLAVKEVDERFTSKMAARALVEMGMKKKQRQQKGMVDQVAATMMLQEYMQAGL